MKGRTLVGFMLLILLASGCASNKPSTFSTPGSQKVSLESLAKLMAEQGFVVGIDATTWTSDGHFFTVDYIAELAGVPRERQQNLSCYSQAPDEVLRYNAVPVSIWGIVTPTYRSQIVNGLHSLHGGNHDQVVARRAKLAELINASYHNNETPDWQTGFLIHALGDSFAHVYGDFDNSQAYGELVGHGFAFFKDPDDIYNGLNYKKYNAYLLSLYGALAANRSEADFKFGEQTIRNFSADLEKVVIGKQAHDKDLSLKLSKAHTNANNLDSCQGKFEFLNHSEVKKFLVDLRTQLN